MLEGGADAVDKAFRRLLGPRLDISSLKRQPQAWGGSMDAGDWDRNSLHLRVSYLQLEVFEMFPAFFEKVKLALPPHEANDRLPDVVDEALWGFALFRRLQDADGGVGGEIESTAHPRPGEASWQESLLVGAVAPDPVSSYRYAAAAAKLSGVLERYDDRLAATYRASAERARHWAEKNARRVIEEVRGRGGRVKGSVEEIVAEPRALAAVELFRLTRDRAYYAALRESAALTTGGDAGAQLDVTFACANLPDGLGEAKLNRQALDVLRAQGDLVLRMSRGNAFNVGCPPPRGITVYGPHDPTKAMGWVKTWVLANSMVPPCDDWPASEFHVGVSGWVEMSEYTVHQSIGPTGYYWGYLAARAAKSSANVTPVLQSQWKAFVEP